MGILDLFRDKPKQAGDRFNGNLQGPIDSSELARRFGRATWLIDNNGVIYGKNVNTGSFHVYKDGKLNTHAAYLAAGESIREMSSREYRERIEIRKETTRSLIQYKTEMKRKFDEKSQSMRGSNALDREARFTQINGELVQAWQKDVKGGIIEGGAVGWISSFWRKSNLSKALNKIAQTDPAMADKVRNSIDMIFREHQAEIQALAGGKSNSALRYAGDVLGPIVGLSPESVIQRIKTDPDYTRRAEASIGTMLSLAVSSALGSPDVLIGMVRLPIKARRSANPSKDIIAYALFGQSYNEIAGNADRETRKYNAGINTQKQGPERGSLDRMSGSLGTDIHMHEIYGSKDIKNAAPWYLWIGKAQINRLQDPNVPVRDKINTLNGAIARAQKTLERNPADHDSQAALDAAKRLLSLYNEKYRMRSIETREELGNAKQLSKILNQFQNFDEFKQAIQLPNPQAERYLRVWYNGGSVNRTTYEPRDPALTQFMWYSPLVPGIQDMTDAYTKKGKALTNYLSRTESVQSETSRNFNNITRRGNKYAGDITKTVGTKDELADYVDITVVNGTRLSALYASQINKLMGADVNPQQLTMLIRKNAQKSTMSGANTAFNQSQIRGINYNGPVWAFPVLVTAPNGQRVKLQIGIKPNCANLVFGGAESQDMSGNGANANSSEYFRLPVTAGLFEMLKPSKKAPEKPTQTNKPTAPTKTPTAKASSTPNSTIAPSANPHNGIQYQGPGTDIPGSLTTTTATLPAAPTSTSAGGSALPNVATPLP